MKNDFIPKFLNKLFSEFDRLNINYCVLHSYEDLPDKVESDVDMAIDKRGMEMLDRILRGVACETGSLLTQKRYYGGKSLSFFVTQNTQDDYFQHSLQLDFCVDFNVRNNFYLSNHVILHEKRRYKNFWVSMARVEAIYIVIKRVTKGNIEEKNLLRIRELYLEDKCGVQRLLNKTFGKAKSLYLKDRILKSDCASFNEQLKKLKNFLLLRTILYNPAKTIVFWFWNLVRVIKRVNNPVGMMIVFLGPDGAGKSSIINRIAKNVPSGFTHGSASIHFRPRWLPPIHRLLHPCKKIEDNIVIEPHKNLPYGLIISLFRFLYYTADFVLGYYPKIYLPMVRDTLVIIDRYYYDYLIDPRRYRMGLPAWIPRLAMNIIPRPDLVIYLHNFPEKLHERKQELPIEELGRQVKAFQALLPKLKSAHQVNTDKSLEEVVAEVNSIIIDAMARRISNDR